MPTKTQHLEQRVAALQSDLNARDQVLDEPVYMLGAHGSCCWEEIGNGSLEVFQSIPEEYRLRALYTRAAEQPANGTTSDKCRAELYDEVWQKARDKVTSPPEKVAS